VLEGAYLTRARDFRLTGSSLTARLVLRSIESENGFQAGESDLWRVIMVGKRDTDVLVVGGGPVGLFTALALARKGVRVMIIEEQWKPASRSYALALHPESVRMLKEFGLGPALSERANPVGSLGLYGDGERRARIDFSRLQGDGSSVLVLPQHLLEGILQKAVEAAGVTVSWSHRLADFAKDENGIHAEVQRLVKESTGYSVTRTEWVVDKTFEVSAAFLVGADGHRSMVRRKLGITTPESGAASTFAVFEFSTDSASGNEVEVVLGSDTVSVLWPLPDGRYRWSFEMPALKEGIDPRVKSRLFVQFRDDTFPHVSEDRLAGLIAERAPWFSPKVTETGWSAAVRFERRLADRFGEGRAWLVGDSAHLALPIGIQSMNVGFREGADLADRIAQVLHRGAALDVVEAFGGFWRERWRSLLQSADAPQVKPTASSWIRANAARIPPCIPASGDDLCSLLGQIDIG